MRGIITPPSATQYTDCLIGVGGIPCFAPSKEAAQLEGSKIFAKSLMKKYDIPTAAYRSFSTYDHAVQYLEEIDTDRVVIKADGLAAGKGVMLPSTKAEARRCLKEILVDGKFGSAGRSVLIEEFLEGEEISVLSFCDGKTFLSLPIGQDHKRALGGDEGPNTGGMGVYAPVPFVGERGKRDVDDVVGQTLDAMTEEVSADSLPAWRTYYAAYI